MRKGFTRKPQGDEPATQCKNYITPSGLQRLKDEHRFLLTRERPAVNLLMQWESRRQSCFKIDLFSGDGVLEFQILGVQEISSIARETREIFKRLAG